jgi:hypothetical protein
MVSFSSLIPIYYLLQTISELLTNQEATRTIPGQNVKSCRFVLATQNSVPRRWGAAAAMTGKAGIVSKAGCSWEMVPVNQPYVGTRVCRGRGRGGSCCAWLVANAMVGRKWWIAGSQSGGNTLGAGASKGRRPRVVPARPGWPKQDTAGWPGSLVGIFGPRGP